MSLTPGTRLGPYEIIAPLGAGGMGEVYRARDTKLNRDVAIKVLPESFALDADRVARFTREAQVLASLNHPNIAGIYGIEEQGSTRALVMELVEGEDLSAHISRGAIALSEALPIAKQIADALEAAHEQGIVHRDLKPQNIKVRADGTVKVLDFGLAKALDRTLDSGPGNLDAANSPTLTVRGTQMGMILGTAAYMAPEQARGRAVDKRADIWAFGVVLFEMLAGRRAFEGDDVTEVLAAVLKTDPEWGAIPSAVPPTVNRLLRRCLEKDPKRRLRDIAEGMLQLDEPAGSATTVPTPRARASWAVAGVAMAAALALAIPAVRHLRETPPALPPETRTVIDVPADAARVFALSPDGRQIVFSAESKGTRQLWIRPLSSATARPLSGTEGGARPFWSPDGRSIGFFTDKLNRIDIDGTNFKSLTRSTRATSAGTWGADGTIVFTTGVGPLYRTDGNGPPQPLTALGPGERAHLAPQFLPDGRRFVFTVAGEPNTVGVYLGALDGRPPKRLTSDSGTARYWFGWDPRAPGWLLQLRQPGVLYAQPLDLEREVLGNPVVTVAEHVATISTSATGLIAYRTGDLVRARQLQLTWHDLSGRPLQNVGDAGDFGMFGISPDGRHVAMVLSDGATPSKTDIWMLDVARGLRSRFTFADTNESGPAWSSDGRSVAFSSDRKGHADLYRKSIDGAIGSEELVLADEHDKAPSSWSRDGRFLLYTQNGPNGKSDVWVLPMTGDRKPFPFAQTEFWEAQPAFSPDGRWVAFVSDESGAADIYAAPFPGPGARRLISAKQAGISEGGVPAWRADGGAIFYIAPDRTLMVVDVKIKGTQFEAGVPRKLFGPIPGVGGRNYEVSADGTRVLSYSSYSTPADDVSGPITLIQNWQPAVKK